MLNAFGSPRNLDKRRLQLAKTIGVVQAAGDGVVQAAGDGVVQAAGDGVVQAAHRRSWCFCVCGVWLALALVRIRREIEREVHTAAPKVRPHARACAHARPRHRRGVGERPHLRGSVERTASLAVAKQGAAVAKQGGLGELSCLCKVYRPKRRPAEGAVLLLSLIHISEPTRQAEI